MRQVEDLGHLCAAEKLRVFRKMRYNFLDLSLIPDLIKHPYCGTQQCEGYFFLQIVSWCRNRICNCPILFDCEGIRVFRTYGQCPFCNLIQCVEKCRNAALHSYLVIVHALAKLRSVRLNLINGLLIFVEYLTNPVLTEAGIRLIGTGNKFFR